MNTKYQDYSSTHKIGEYEFVAKVHYMPSFIITRRVRVSIELMKTKSSTETWKRSVIVNHSKTDHIIRKFIRSYFEKVNYFSIA